MDDMKWVENPIFKEEVIEKRGVATKGRGDGMEGGVATKGGGNWMREGVVIARGETSI